MLNFRGIPEGVTVTASMMGTGMPMEDDGTDLAPLNLVTGDTEGADEDGVVSLSSAGVGEIVYTFDTGFTTGETIWAEGPVGHGYKTVHSPGRRRQERME